MRMAAGRAVVWQRWQQTELRDRKGLVEGRNVEQVKRRRQAELGNSNNEKTATHQPLRHHASRHIYR
jgi:hypothetical protein